MSLLNNLFRAPLRLGNLPRAAPGLLTRSTQPQLAAGASTHMRTMATQSVPEINLEPFLKGSQAERANTANQVFSAFKDIGFITVANHGISNKMVDDSFKMSAEFFAKDIDYKEKLLWTSAESNRGWLGPGKEKLADGKADLKESFEIGAENEPQFPNHWPGDWPEFREHMLALLAEMDKVHLELMRCLAVELKYDEGFFDPLCDGHHYNLRLLHYHETEAENIGEDGPNKNPRAGAHTDYGTLTLLFQDQTGGLQVMDRGNQWVQVTPKPYTLVVNVADLLMRWTNDILVSTEHRVLTPPNVDSSGVARVPARYSIVLFCNPNKETLVECLEGCHGPGNPPKYPPINSFDYLTQRLNDTI
eukprot:GFYU01005705.1.p1 GENE.GFYU01005705.1~~GFYU01005705.1.p1  ORF type:complete len:361 (+),score=81.97 GFYU01005705.1:109-1191(+)